MTAERQAWPPGGLRLTLTTDTGHSNHVRQQITAGVGSPSKSSMQVLTSRQARRAYGANTALAGIPAPRRPFATRPQQRPPPAAPAVAPAMAAAGLSTTRVTWDDPWEWYKTGSCAAGHHPGSGCCGGRRRSTASGWLRMRCGEPGVPCLPHERGQRQRLARRRLHAMRQLTHGGGSSDPSGPVLSGGSPWRPAGTWRGLRQRSA